MTKDTPSIVMIDMNNCHVYRDIDNDTIFILNAKSKRFNEVKKRIDNKSILIKDSFGNTTVNMPPIPDDDNPTLRVGR